jgi:hypothetical protein
LRIQNLSGAAQIHLDATQTHFGSCYAWFGLVTGHIMHDFDLCKVLIYIHSRLCMPHGRHTRGDIYALLLQHQTVGPPWYHLCCLGTH